MRTPVTGAARSIALAALIELTTLAAAESGRAESNDLSPRYQVTVRQVEGYESVPAHMVCALNKLCRGVMSISTAHGHRRVFVTGMIDGANAYFGFRAEERDLSCSRGQDFLHLVLGPPPMTVHAYAFACDAPPSHSDSVQGPIAEPPAPKTITPPLATLRIDLRSLDSFR